MGYGAAAVLVVRRRVIRTGIIMQSCIRCAAAIVSQNDVLMGGHAVCQRWDRSVQTAFLTMVDNSMSIRSAVRLCHLLHVLLGYCQAVDAKVVAYTCDDKMSPFPVYNRGEDKVRA